MSRRNRIAAAFALIVVLSVALYARKLDNQFVYDDHAFIAASHEHENLGNIPGFFLTDQHRLYRPMRSVIYTIVRQFGNGPLSHHIAGILVHTALCCLLLLIVLQLSGDLRLATIAAVIATIHPVHVARVGNMTGSFDLFGMAFAYGAVSALIVFLRKDRLWAFFLGIALFTLGLLASEEAATVPLFLVLIFMAFPSKRSEPATKRFALTLFLVVIILVAYLRVRSAMIPGFSRVADYQAGGLIGTLMTMSVVFWRYISLFVAPVGLVAEHSVRIYGVQPKALIAMAGLAVLAIVAFAVRKKRPLVFVGIGWFFIGLAPFSNLIPLQTLMAEHYFYSGLNGLAILASIGICAVLDAVADKPTTQKAAWGAMVIGAAILFVLSALRVDVWKNDETLWRDAVSKDPHTYMANLNWSNVLSRQGKTEQAHQHLLEALKYRPSGFEAYNGLGNYYQDRKNPEKAKEMFLTSLKYYPNNIPGLSGLMQTELVLGNTEQALKIADVLLRHDGNNIAALNLMGYILARSGNCEKAIPYLEKVVAGVHDPGVRDAATANLNHCRQKTDPETQ